MKQLLFLLFSSFILSISLNANEKISLQLLWKHQFEFAGFYIAKEKGFYKELGLDVTIKEYDFGINIIDDVMSAKSDIGIGRSALVLDKLQGKDIVLLNALYQSTPYVLLSSQRDDLKSVADFAGKKIMLSDNLESVAAISSMMRVENIQATDYIEIPHSFDINDLVEGKVDLVTTYLSNEPYHLESLGEKYTVFDPKEYGFDFYADIVFTSGKYLSENEEQVKKFKEASLKGWEYAFKNIDEACELILFKYNTQHKTRDALTYEAKVLRKLAYKDGVDFGTINEDKIKNIANVYRLLGLTNNPDIILDDLVYSENTLASVLRQVFTFEVFTALMLLILLLALLFFYKQYLLEEQNKKLEDLVKEKTMKLQESHDSLEVKVDDRTKKLQEQSDLMEHLANHDSLTKLPNRLLFLDRLRQSIKHMKRKSSTTSVLFLDLDRFKDINDTYGHSVGDALLIKVSKILLSCVREEDTVSRLGGDEFTIIIEDAYESSVRQIIDNIVTSMRNKFVIENHEIFITFSIGVSSYPKDGNDSEVLLRNADTAMYKAKENGRNQYQFYNEEMTLIAIHKSKIELDLRNALENEELESYFQPKIDAKSNKVIGMEALVRWNHPELGTIMPGEFMAIAEDTGLVVAIDKWMMKNTLEIIKRWHKEGLKTGKLALNLSVKHLESDDCIDRIQEDIAISGVDTKYIELEVTESHIMHDVESTIKKLEEIRKIGVSISVDDFGTGYSSLSYLKRLPIDTLKIDYSFINSLLTSEEDKSIVRAIIAMSKSLKLGLIAEGVETKEQLDFLLIEGCRNIQGYYYSKPLNEEDYKVFLTTYQ